MVPSEPALSCATTQPFSKNSRTSPIEQSFKPATTRPQRGLLDSVWRNRIENKFSENGFIPEERRFNSAAESAHANVARRCCGLFADPLHAVWVLHLPIGSRHVRLFIAWILSRLGKYHRLCITRVHRATRALKTFLFDSRKSAAVNVSRTPKRGPTGHRALRWCRDYCAAALSIG